MVPRKRKIVILVSIIVLTVLIITVVLAILYLKTDMFKSNQTLFAKYMMQNLNAVEVLKNEDTLGIENELNTNKYESKIEGNIQYTENIGTSAENSNSDINKIKLKINSNVDKQENYNYKDISIGTDDEDLIKLEYLNQDEIYGVRLDGIKQFVSIEKDKSDEILKEFGIENMQGLLATIDYNSILNFTESEKQSLMNTYMGIMEANVSKDKYSKQANTLITVNNQDMKTNAYCMKLTIEEYNNLCIKILEQITKDEIILSKVDLLETTIKEKYPNYEQDKSLRELVVNNINNKIEEIKDNNIGNDEVKIIVYENNMQTVRTSIEKSLNKTTLDLYDNSYIKVDNIELGEEENEQSMKIEKDSDETQANTVVEFKNVENNEIINNIQMNYKQSLDSEKISKSMELEVSNVKYKSVLNIKDDIKLVDEFEDQVTLENNSVKLNDLEKEQIELIKNILDENIQNQLSDFYSVTSQSQYKRMLQNIGVIKKNKVQIPDTVEVTDIERKRFNSQFEFFESEDLTSENIKDLIKTAESNFEDMKIVLKNGQVQELDSQKMSSNNSESAEYKKNISEILISIKQNSTNEDKKQDVIKFVEDNSNNKYTVALEYDDNGLVKTIRIKLQQEE